MLQLRSEQSYMCATRRADEDVEPEKPADDSSLVVFIEGTLACYNILFICSGALMFLSFEGVRLLLLLLLCNNRFV